MFQDRSPSTLYSPVDSPDEFPASYCPWSSSPPSSVLLCGIGPSKAGLNLRVLVRSSRREITMKLRLRTSLEMPQKIQSTRGFLAWDTYRDMDTAPRERLHHFGSMFRARASTRWNSVMPTALD